MSDISYWAKAANADLGQCIVSSRELGDITCVRFARFMTLPEPGTVYVGTGQEVHSILIGGKSCIGTTFFVSDASPGLLRAAKDAGINLIVSHLDTIALHNSISELAMKYLGWSQRITGNCNIQDLVDTAYDIARMPLFLINAGRRVIYYGGIGYVRNNFTHEMLQTGLLSEESMRYLTDGSVQEGAVSPMLMYRAFDDGGGCWIHQVLKDESIISSMLLFVPAGREDFDSETLLKTVRNTLGRIVSDTGEYWAGAGFKALLDDIISQKIKDEREINHRFAMISRMPKKFCNFIIIGFEGNCLPNPPTHLLTQLEEIFPESNTAVYDDSIVLMLSRPGREFQPAPLFDRERFDALLAKYEACAAISNATSHREMLHINYLITKSILRLGRALRSAATSRIFFHEEYVEYYMIDLCCKSFTDLLLQDTIVYLTHPAAIRLARYDKEHDTDLLDIMYHYCVVSGNTAQTAKKTYMHRNTAATRIAKIRELTQADIDDPRIRQRMIISYKIIKYCEKYAYIDLFSRK